MNDERDDPGGPVDVFLYGDYVCPFSYVVDARLRRLRDGLDLRLHWRPLSIHPAVPTDGLPIDQTGRPPDEWARVEAGVSDMAREEELAFELPDFVANSHEALQAGEFARDVGADAFRRAHRALFEAYFVDGRNLGRREVLLDVAETAGLDREGLEGALEDGRYEEELERASREAERYDIEGTPTLLFGRHKVVGAAPEDVLREAADRAREDRETDRAPGNGPVDGGDAPPPGDGPAGGDAPSPGDGRR